MIDLEALRAEAQQLLREWDEGLWQPVDDANGHEVVKTNPGAIAERCIALIAEVEQLRQTSAFSLPPVIEVDPKEGCNVREPHRHTSAGGIFAGCTAVTVGRRK